MPFQPIPVADRFWGKVDKSEGCWLWTGMRDERGYGRIAINRKNVRAHRIAYELTYGDLRADLVVRHSCDTPACVNPEHLLPGTQLDNIADRNDRDRTFKGKRLRPKTRGELERDLKGERNGRAKLTQAQAAEIRQRYAAGNIGARPLAKMFGVSRSLIRFIVQGKNWKHDEQEAMQL